MSMKVLQLGKFYPIRGGLEKVIYDLTVGLSNKGIRCDMLCASTEGQPSGNLKINDLAEIIIVPTLFKVASTMISPSMIMTIRKIANNYDIIHIHHPDPMAALALFFSGFKGRVILHWHSDILKQKKMLLLYSSLQSWLIKRADLIVGTTPVYVEQSPFLEKVKNKVSYIPIGIEPIQQNKALINKIKAENEGKFIVFALGRLVEYKGFGFLIKAAQFLGDNYKIIIAGKGPLYETLNKQIVDLKVQDKVKLLGYVSDEESHAYFHACDTFVLSSIFKTEAFAIVQIEAMSCAKPIISTAIKGSGVQWVNKNDDSGLVIPPCDEFEIANSIEILANDSTKYQSLAKGSLRRFQEMFTHEKMINKCLELYSTFKF